MKEDTAIFIYGDGSFNDAAQTTFPDLIERMRDRLPELTIEAGIEGPSNLSLEVGLDAVLRCTPKTVVCVPATLFGADHERKELPLALQTFAADHPQIHLLLARDLVVDGRLLSAARDRIVSCVNASASEIKYSDSLLMLVGRETSDTSANANVAKAARLLWEGMGFGWAEVSYCGNTRPSVSVGMEHAIKLGFKRIVVIPAFLYADQSVATIYSSVEKIAAINPNIEFMYAEQLQDHPLLIESLVDRINEALKGSNAMNCMLCTYRDQVVGDDTHPHEVSHAHTHTHEHGHDHHPSDDHSSKD